MPFPSLDEAFKSSIKDDVQIFDNLEVMRIDHISDNATPDFATGTSIRNIVTYEVPNCLQRQPSLRDGPSVPQLHERSVSIQKDGFVKTDVVIEVPFTYVNDQDIEVEVRLRVGDTITRIQRGDIKYTVVMIDTATLETRWRLGCSRLN